MKKVMDAIGVKGSGCSVVLVEVRQTDVIVVFVMLRSSKTQS